MRRTPRSTLFPTRRSSDLGAAAIAAGLVLDAWLMPINKNLWTPSYAVFMTGCSLAAFAAFHAALDGAPSDRKSTRLNSSHGYISYAVFCLKKKTYRRARLS